MQISVRARRALWLRKIRHPCNAPPHSVKHALRQQVRAVCSERISIMKALVDLFSTDYGLMSVAGIAFMLGMGVFFVRLFTSKMNDSAKQAGK